MVNLELLYEEIDSLWPAKRHIDVKAKEKEELAAIVITDSDADKVKNKVEITIEDYKTTPRKIPSLISTIASVKSAAAKPIFVSKSIDAEPEEEVKDAVTITFEELFDAWPENDIKQNEKYAKIAFISACKNRPLEEIKAACLKYIQDMNNPSKASAHILGMKRFVSEDDILDTWLQKASTVTSDYDTSYFEAVYARYPEFTGKSDLSNKNDSLNFYKRFIKEEDAVDFYCAVLAYAEERRDEIREQRFKEDYEPDSDVKYTKKFINFIRVWKQQKRWHHLADLMEVPALKAFKKRNVYYSTVYEGQHFCSALQWNCQQKGEDGCEKGVVFAVTKILEDVCNNLTTGKNWCNMVISTPVDYSFVSEVIAEMKQEVKKMPEVKKNYVGMEQP
jgi:hypothetical protein